MSPADIGLIDESGIDPNIIAWLFGGGAPPAGMTGAPGGDPRNPGDSPPNGDPNQDALKSDIYALQDLSFQAGMITAMAAAIGFSFPPAAPAMAAIGAFFGTISLLAGYQADVLSRSLDPLLIDLDGDGIDLSGFVSIDFDGDGYLETGRWVSADDGILVLDLGLDGKINRLEELNLSIDGTAGRTDLDRLSFFDSNGDGTFNRFDARFSEFRIWQDLNQDGVSQAGELFTLADKGVDGIDLGGRPVEPGSQGAVYWFDTNGDGIIADTEIYASAAEAPEGARPVRAIDGGYVLDSTDATTSSGVLAAYSVALSFFPVGATARAEGQDIIVSPENGPVQRFHVLEGTVGQAFDLTGTGYSGVIGTDGNDTLTAGTNGAWLVGGGGNDILIGRAGDDILAGGTGTDDLSGGAGDDMLHIDSAAEAAHVSGGEGTDTLFIDGPGPVAINLSQADIETAFGSSGSDQLTALASSADVKLFGGDGNDILSGGSGNDILSGDAGADSMSGGAGNDVLLADGTDTVDGGAGYDMLFVSSTTGTSIDLTAASIEAAYGNAGNDVLSSSGISTAISLSGGAGNDILTGGSANDVIAGDAGDDTLAGGAGTDTARFSGKMSDYTITADGNGYVVTDNNLADGNDGTDRLQGIEKLVFSDKTLHLDALNSAPVAADEHLQLRNTGDGAALTVQDLTRNDADADADHLNVVAISRAEGGDVSIASDGSIRFASAGVGAGSFSYQVDDGHGGQSWATATLAVSQALPTDPLFQYQWGLEALNIFDVWDDYSGNGLKIAIIESGAQTNHPDLSSNFDDDDISSAVNQAHGTWVSGLIGADRDNGGIVGVAYDATFTIETPLFGILYMDLSVYDVVNASFDLPLSNIGTGDSPNDSRIENFAEVGRSGLGTVFVFSAKNGGEDGDDSNASDGQNSRHSVVVGAIDTTGHIAPFSTPGASVLVVAPGTELISTDMLGSDGYSDDSAIFGSDYAIEAGTSGSAPLISGVVALMLEANPELGWRDVQEILAYSAWNTDSLSSGWSTNGAGNWNGGGLHFSRDYGFGLVDARAAVRLAETWTKTSTSANEVSASADATAGFVIPDKGAGSAVLTIANDVRVESVEIKLDISHANVGDLVIELTSPDGTTSILLNRYGVTPGSTTDTGSSLDGFIWTFTSKNFWGELGAGQWTLTVRDMATGAVGQVNDWSLAVYGATPTQDDTYIYTVDYGSVSSNSDRRVLTDTAGHDTINVSPIFEDAVLDLRSGATSHLGGGDLTIAAGTVIEDAFLGDGNDRVTGNAVANALSGGRGDDTLEGGAGADRLDGGKGEDTASYAGSAAAVAVNLLSGGVSGGDAQGDILVSIESVAGSALADTLTGNQADNTLTGNAGDDLLSGGVGRDTLIGGAGVDTLQGGDGDDILAGGAGNDRIEGGDGVDAASFSGRASDYVISFVAGVLTVTGLDGVDQLFGIELLKFLDKTIGADASNVAPTAVSKTFTLTQNQAFTLTEANLLQGVLDADGDALALHAVYASAHGVVTLTSANGIGFQVDAAFVGTATFDYVVSDNRGGEARATLTFIVNPTFAFDGTTGADVFAGLGSADTVHGLDGNDSLDGGFGNDRLFGDVGDDVLSGGAGSDQIDGGAGIDTARYQAAVVGVAVDLGSGTGTGGEAAGDTLTGIENLIGSLFGDTLLGDAQDNQLHGLAGEDVLRGGGGADKLWGEDGNDRLSGGAGVDTLSGGAGADVLVGGSGADTLDGGIGIDIASYADSTGAVTINLTSGSKVGADAVGDSYVSIEGLEGSDFADALTGSAAADSLLGGGGDDTINGAAGADTLTGGLGNDSLAGGSGNDTYRYAPGDGNDSIVEAIAPNDNDRLVLGIGLNAADAILTRSTTDVDDVTLGFRGQAGSIFLDEQFNSSTTGYGLEQIVFGDGITWSKTDLQNAYIARTQTAGDDTIYGFNGSTTFAIPVLAGNDRIVEGVDASAIDQLALGTGLNVADLILTRSTSDLNDITLAFQGKTGSIMLDNEFQGAGYGIEQIVFGDGTVWSKADLQAAYLIQAQTTANDTIYGFNGSTTFVVLALAGNDRIVEDIYLGDDRLVLGAGLNVADLILTRSTTDLDDITLSFQGRPGSITLDEQFRGSGYGIEQIVFGDGTTWSKADLQAAYLTQAQTAGNDTIYGFGGPTTFTFSVLAGSDWIVEDNYPSDIDQLVFGAGLNAVDLILTRSTGDIEDITLSFRGRPGSITLDEQFRGSGYGIEQIVFGDGTTWSKADLQAAYLTQAQTAGNDTIYGFGGPTTFTFSVLAGSDWIVEDNYPSDIDQLVFGAGLNVADLILTRSTTDLDDITLSFQGRPGSITLDEQFRGSGYGIEQIVFGDGTTWSKADLQAAYLNQAAAGHNVTIVGFSSADTIFGGHGNDTLSGAGGNDVLNGNDGNDTLNGGDGNDAHFGGAGDDILYGNLGSDTFDGGNGIDTIDFTYYTGIAVIDLTAGTATFTDGSSAEQVLNVENIIAGNGNSTLIGTGGANILTGGSGNDTISGGDGNDVINGGSGNDGHFGGAGDDLLYGNVGADSFDGGDGVDTLNFTYYASNVTIDLAAGTAGFTDGSSAEQVLNVEDVVAGSGNDTVSGTAAANRLSGGAGADVLTGGLGADLLTGGAGTDTFGYANVADSTVAAAGKDTILDFATGDRINLSAIDADGNAGNGDTAFTFGTGNFTGPGQIRVVVFENNRYGVYIETTGDQTPESIINVYSDHALTATDFVL